MSFLSMKFLLFLAAAVAGYYVIPRQLQWVWLLIFSYIFYLASGPAAVVFILTTTATTFLGGLWLEHTDRALACALDRTLARDPDRTRTAARTIHWTAARTIRWTAARTICWTAARTPPAPGQSSAAPFPDEKALKGRFKQRKKWIVALVLFVNFGILAALKYRNFAADNMNLLFGTHFSSAKLLLPLGISFYTFQSMGYLIDVYRGKYAPDRNPFRFALFVSFFPQILQGPIGRYDRLASQLYGQKSFSLTRIERGLQLMLWGYFKKIVIADRAAVVVSEVFGNYQSYGCILVMAGVLCYSLQLYGDFSGGMDVIMGASECFGISLDANFKRPYFAQSISDFWHRWHITLGTWMKDYVFYPFSLSKGMNKFGKFCKKHFGKHVSRVLPVCIANLLVFFLVGVWHGPAWKFIVYGLYNGTIIAASNLFAPLREMARKLHIPVESRPWMAVRILRTFLLVNISWYFDMAVSLGAALTMMKNTVTGFSLAALSDGRLLRLGLIARTMRLWSSPARSCWQSAFQENHVNIRDTLSAKPLARWCVYLMLLFPYRCWARLP